MPKVFSDCNNNSKETIGKHNYYTSIGKQWRYKNKNYYLKEGKVTKKEQFFVAKIQNLFI